MAAFPRFVVLLTYLQIHAISKIKGFTLPLQTTTKCEIHRLIPITESHNFDGILESENFNLPSSVIDYPPVFPSDINNNASPIQFIPNCMYGQDVFDAPLIFTPEMCAGTIVCTDSNLNMGSPIFYDQHVDIPMTTNAYAAEVYGPHGLLPIIVNTPLLVPHIDLSPSIHLEAINYDPPYVQCNAFLDNSPLLTAPAPPVGFVSQIDHSSVLYNNVPSTSIFPVSVTCSSLKVEPLGFKAASINCETDNISPYLPNCIPYSDLNLSPSLQSVYELPPFALTNIDPQELSFYNNLPCSASINPFVPLDIPFNVYYNYELENPNPNLSYYDFCDNPFLIPLDSVLVPNMLPTLDSPNIKREIAITNDFPIQSVYSNPSGFSAPLCISSVVNCADSLSNVPLLSPLPQQCLYTEFPISFYDDFDLNFVPSLSNPYVCAPSVPLVSSLDMASLAFSSPTLLPISPGFTASLSSSCSVIPSKPNNCPSVPLVESVEILPTFNNPNPCVMSLPSVEIPSIPNCYPDSFAFDLPRINPISEFREPALPLIHLPSTILNTDNPLGKYFANVRDATAKLNDFIDSFHRRTSFRNNIRSPITLSQPNLKPDIIPSFVNPLISMPACVNAPKVSPVSEYLASAPIVPTSVIGYGLDYSLSSPVPYNVLQESINALSYSNFLPIPYNYYLNNFAVPKNSNTLTPLSLQSRKASGMLRKPYPYLSSVSLRTSDGLRLDSPVSKLNQYNLPPSGILPSSSKYVDGSIADLCSQDIEKLISLLAMKSIVNSDPNYDLNTLPSILSY